MPRRAALLLFLAGLIAGCAWLLGSTSGLRAVASLAAGTSGGRLQIEVADGRLLGPIDLAHVHWQSPTWQVVAEAVHLDWSLGSLWHGRLQIHELHGERLRITPGAAPPASPPPEQLTLPWPVDLEQVSLSQLEFGDALAASQLHGEFHSDGQDHRFKLTHAQAGQTILRGELSLAGRAPLDLDATATLSGQVAAQPLQLIVTAKGPLARLPVTLQASAGLTGQGALILTPFAAQPLVQAKLALNGLNPRAWLAEGPTAALDLEAELSPNQAGLSGYFRLLNRLPGPVDRGALPVKALGGRISWHEAQVQLDQLQAKLPGQGELTGQGQWQVGQLRLTLAARQLDAGQIVQQLRPTRFNGVVSAQLGEAEQTLNIDLRDPRFQLTADLSRRRTTLTLSRLALSAGPARLSASGTLELAGERRFKIAGDLNRFDPARFAQVPTATLNARLAAEGKLAPHPKIIGQFTLHDSLLAGHPLIGQGQLDVDWPRIPRAEINLAAGPNQLKLRGAFGRPGEQLQLRLDAPQLAPYGLAGGLSGDFRLSGSPQRPALNASLQSDLLGLPGGGRLQHLQLTAQAGSERQSPLQVELNIERIDSAQQAFPLKNIRLKTEGDNQQHRLSASAEQAQERLELAGEGSLHLDPAWRWQGQLSQLRMTGQSSLRQFHLSKPAAFDLRSTGWQFGPAQIQGDGLDWQASLAASADGKHLQSRLQGRSTRLGQLDARLDAALLGPWTLNPQAPWQGQLKLAFTDLGWLAESLAEGWQSAGRLDGQLTLAGTPASPLLSGQLNGENLDLRQPGQGLHLTRGELAVALDRNLLRVHRLGFDSLLQPLPRPLKQSAQDLADKLTARPGRLAISGEMRIDRAAGADSAWLDLNLDRFGVYQLPDQWVALSGNGRLSWQDGTLGAHGKLTVDAGYWQLAPSGAPRLSDDVTIKRPGQTPAPPLRSKLALDLTTDLGEHFLFSGAGLTARLAGDVRLQANGRDLPRASGSIRTRAGRFEAYGQKLALERGILTFQGLPDNPALDVRAVRQGLAVEPGVQIGGTAQRPVIKLISDPDLPDAEKLSWLVLGHGPEQMNASDAPVLLSAASGLLGNDSANVVQQVKKTFGLDDFGVRQGELGDSGSRRPGSRIAASGSSPANTTGSQIFSLGKRLSSNALLSYEQALGKAESIVKLTVNLGRQVSLVGRAGSDNALDIFWTKRFGEAKPAPP